MRCAALSTTSGTSCPGSAPHPLDSENEDDEEESDGEDVDVDEGSPALRRPHLR
jgi:hypothetical protein